jgi:cytochrome c oxidase subunit 2
MKMNKKIIALLIVTLALLYGCAQPSEVKPAPAEAPEPVISAAPEEQVTETEPAEKETVTAETPDTAAATPPPEPTVKEFSVIAKQFEFVPGTITVDKGDRVVLKVKSVDVAHGIAIREFNINEHLEPGEEVTIEFVADKAGKFDMYCNVFCGSGHGGMRGQLIVR